MKHNGYFTFQTIIDSWDVRCHFFGVVCVGSPVTIINYLQKKLTNKYTQKMEFSTRVGTIIARVNNKR